MQLTQFLSVQRNLIVDVLKRRHINPNLPFFTSMSGWHLKL